MTPEQRFRAARWGYVAVVLLATLTQLHFSSDLTAAGERLVRAFTPSLGWRDAIDGLRNTVLFAGLGAVWVVSSRSGNVRAEIRRSTLVGLALSATVEGLQVFSPVRTASIVDVTTNTLGALLGAGGVALLIAAVVAAKGARSYLGVPTFLLAAAYGGAALCEALTPLFGPGALPALTPVLRGAARARAALFAYGGLLVLWGWRLFMPRTDAHAIAAQLAPENLVPLASLAERVDAFSALHVLQQFLLYVPLGTLLAVWPLRLSGRWAHLWPGVWLAVVLELGHAVIVGRTFDVTNALVACAGLGIGWIVVRRSGFAPYGEALAAPVAR